MERSQAPSRETQGRMFCCAFAPAKLPCLSPTPLLLGGPRFWSNFVQAATSPAKKQKRFWEWMLHLPWGNEERSAKFTAQHVRATGWGQSAPAVLKIYLFVLKDEVVLWREIKLGWGGSNKAGLLCRLPSQRSISEPSWRVTDSWWLGAASSWNKSGLGWEDGSSWLRSDCTEPSRERIYLGSGSVFV